MPELLSQRVAATVRAELARREKRQGDLADVLGISITQVSDRLRGKIPFKLDELEPTCTLLELPLASFFAEVSAGWRSNTSPATERGEQPGRAA